MVLRLTRSHQEYNFFRRPEWRFNRVLQLVDRRPTPLRCSKYDDEVVRQARAFLLKWRNGDDRQRDELFAANPGLVSAYLIYERGVNDAEVEVVLQARLLTKMPFNEIALLSGVMPATIEYYEALFFNVRPYLTNRDWITRTILVPAIMRQFAQTDGSTWNSPGLVKPFLDGSLKMFSYFGGPLVLDAMLHGFKVNQSCTSPDKLGEWLDGHWATVLRARSSAASAVFPIKEFAVGELFMAHAKIMELEKAEEAAGGPRNAIESHVGALMDEISWTVGAESAFGLDSTAVPEFDRGAAELRDGELLEAAGGKALPAHLSEEIRLLELPASRRREEKKEESPLPG